MKACLLSFGAGLLVGVVYSLLDVRSPAPPVIALVGLLGISSASGPHVFGAMAGRNAQLHSAKQVANVREVRS
jgi:XapX domain-containing protein